MKKVIVLFCLAVGKFAVLGNPLAQIIPALQTCPHNCNQNSYQNPNTYQNVNTYQNPNTCQNQNYQMPNYQNQNNLNIPVLLQQQNPQQNLQQNTVPTIMQQSSNNQLYPQQNMLQNQMAVPVPSNQVSDPIAQLSQMYMNKILSNPTIQTLLDQNNNLLVHTGQAYPQQVNNIPNTGQNLGNTPPTPTVVNNYFILPPELLNLEKEQVKPPKHSGSKTDRDGLRRTSYDDFEDRRRPNQDGEQIITKRKQAINPDCPVHSKKENHRRPEPVVDEEYRQIQEGKHVTRRNQNNRNLGRESGRGIPPEHRVHPERREEIPRYHEMPRHHEMPRQHDMQRHHDMPRYHEIPRHHENPHPDKRPNLIIKIKEVPKYTSAENIPPRANTDVTNHRRRKQARQSRDDEIIEEFKRKFPAIPEEVVRKLLSYLRRQIQKQQLGQPPFHYPDATFPLRYDQIFPNSYGHDDRNDRRRRPNKRPNKKQQKSVETTTIDDITSTLPTTTERTPIERNESNISSEKQTTDDKITTKQEVETTTNSFFPELGTEDSIEEVSNGIIEDYFPDFTQDRSYFESGEYNIRNLRDNRYHYTTDRNYELRQNKQKNFNEEIDAVLSKPFDTKIETTSSKYEVETEVKFQIPPSLESPDFITKQIIRQKPNPNTKNVSYKSSTYSDAKDPSKSDGKNQKFGNNKKSDNIQTTYAHSKVVKYGKSTDDDEENVTPVVTYYLPDNMQYEDDGKTVIVAKRIPADHFWR